MTSYKNYEEKSSYVDKIFEENKKKIQNESSLNMIEKSLLILNNI